MNVRIIENLEDLNSLRAAWDNLVPNTATPMQQFIWIHACASTFAKEGELRIVVLEDGNSPIAIAPLLQRQRLPTLEILGMAELFEPTDFIYRDNDALLPLARALANLCIPLHLQRLPSQYPLLTAREKGYRSRGFLFRRPDSSCPWIPLNAGWAEPEKQLNSKRRSHLLRIQRIAREFGTVTSEVLSPEPAALAPLLEEAFAVEAASWKGETGTAMALDPLRGAFFRRYATAASELGIFRLCFLRIDGRAAAMQMAIELNGGFWLFKVGYDNQFARCSPGNLLLRETLHYAATRGLQSLHFLGLVEHWTRQWTEEEMTCVDVRGYPFGFQGVTALTGDVMKSAWRKLGQRISIAK